MDIGLMTIVSIIFVLVYALIISEKIHRTIVALVGAAIMLLATFITQEDAVKAIDWNTIGLLIGMMIIVEITKRTGVFEFLAIKGAKIAGGWPMPIMVIMSVITAVTSAVLDNVTTVLLIVPVTFAITRTLNVHPFPFLMAEIFASNIGGAATLIGDPPNIMIGSATKLSFMDFVVNLSPVIIPILAVTCLIYYLMYRKEVQVSDEDRLKIMEFDEFKELRDMVLLKKCLFVLALTIFGFIIHGAIHMEPATIALSGAAVLLLLSGLKPDDVLSQLEWPVIFFFVGLFILVGTLEHVGVIKMIAVESLKLTGGELVLTTMLILWLSAILSAFIDNIPFVATMIPLITDIGQLSGMDVGPLWWALSLGACLGGNGTIIGASANVVVAGMSEQNGYPITFGQYIKVGFGIMLVSIVMSTVYMYFSYLI